MSFGIWATFALAGRQDQDADKIVQYRRDGSDIYRDKWHYWINSDGNKYGPSGSQFSSIPATAVGTLISALKKDFPSVALQLQNGEEITNDQGTFDDSDDTEIGVAGFHKEPNGLKRADEMEFRLDYSFDSDKGSLSYGVLALIHPGVAKADYGPAMEFYVEYAPAVAPFASVKVHVDEDSSDTYTTFALNPEFELGETVSISLLLGATHASRDNISGIMWYDSAMEISVRGFHFGLHGVYREDWRFFDDDGFDTDAPVWIAGASTTSDGLVANPQLNRGYGNAYVNAVTEVIIDEALGRQSSTDFEYTYTPRQKLPRWLFWVSAGYTVDF